MIETGALKCWGQNQRGQLGDGTTADRVVPVNVAELSTGVMALAAGWQHSCALMLNGAIKCWGNNGNGQVGAGNLLLKVTATDVPRISAPAVAVTAGREHTCAMINRDNLGRTRRFRNATSDGLSSSGDRVQASAMRIGRSPLKTEFVRSSSWEGWVP